MVHRRTTTPIAACLCLFRMLPKSVWTPLARTRPSRPRAGHPASVHARVAVLSGLLLVGSLSAAVASCANVRAPSEGYGVLTPTVASICACAKQGIAPRRCSGVPRNLIRTDASGRIQVNVAYSCRINAPTAAAKTAGLQISAQVHAAPFCVMEGWIEPARLATLARVPGIRTISLPNYARARDQKMRR